MAFLQKRGILAKFFAVATALVLARSLFFPQDPAPSSTAQYRGYNVLERVTGVDRSLNVQKHKFLQARVGRDERPDIFDDLVTDGVRDYWNRFQFPIMIGKDTAHGDAQNVLGAVENLLSLNGWVAAYCPTLVRPFGQNKEVDDDAYDDLAKEDRLYYIALAIHSADHFLLDQLAVIVQLAKRLGTSNLFVSMLDYGSTDSTATLTDLCEAVLTLLGVPFRIRRQAPNSFYRVIWLKGFTCPNDILETLRVSVANEAAMVCGMDWAESNGQFTFSDRWRTRDIHGDQFRHSRSSSRPDAVPPRDKSGASRYVQHLPFQVFCCEAGTHIVDPAQSYYKGLKYRYGTDFHNVSSSEPASVRPPDAPCLDSCQAWFCRDLWLSKALEGVHEEEYIDPSQRHSQARPGSGRERRQVIPMDPDVNAGSDFDAMPDSDSPMEAQPSGRLTVPNSAYRPARILVNPRCVTTYAGVSHTQLALDLFGSGEDDSRVNTTKNILDDWEGAPERFVCQEQLQTGGRVAVKTQRLLRFSIHDELLAQHP
ncbi:glycosyltransferase family 69 protein [Pisolithus marmoratus]|nr:glycosyltransferase family 69 protein [Pisolithus marmoratus]